MLTQAQADRLIAMLKEAAREETFVWERDKRQDELVISIEDKKIQFILSLRRNPFESRLHFRTRDRDIGLVRVDNSLRHSNPNGTEIWDQPHIHFYRERENLNWAEPISWYDVNDPLGTLEQFLEIIHTTFPSGYQLDLL